MRGELFAFAVMAIGVVVLICAIDFFIRNMGEALGDELPAAEQKGGGGRNGTATGTVKTSDIAHRETAPTP